MPRIRRQSPAYHWVRCLAAAFLLAMSSGGRVDAGGFDVGPRPPGQFDYYVLALTWVPGFCATHRGHREECAKGLGFGLHGLWPQLNDGDYPADCPAAALTPGEIQAFQGIYADPSLLEHEWPKHGGCSGLTPAAYFTLSARDLRRIRIPAAYRPGATRQRADATTVAAALMAANPGLPLDAIRTVTTRGSLTEIEICLTRKGAFRAC